MFIYLPQVVDSYKICRSQHSKFNLCVISFVQCLIRYLLVWGLYLPPVFKGSGDYHEAIASFFYHLFVHSLLLFVVCRLKYFLYDFLITSMRTVISENFNMKIITRVQGYSSENHAELIICRYFINH